MRNEAAERLRMRITTGENVTLSGMVADLDAALATERSRDPMERIRPLLIRGGYSAPFIDRLIRDLDEAASPALDVENMVQSAAIEECEYHYDQRHINTVVPCAEAVKDARWWANALGLARLTASAVPAKGFYDDPDASGNDR